MRIGAVVRRGAAVGAVALLAAGASLAWAAVVNPNVTPTWQTNGRVNAIQVVGSTVYIGGKFTSVRPAESSSLRPVSVHVKKRVRSTAAGSITIIFRCSGNVASITFGKRW